ncbi:hypothetical protein B0T21DRAFT_409406 [Apiosordaria backusii]|uniref:NACHT domain-containing protein n=1 Tax=Apiosordaria backusii TaxID=314023 RepID=A0AA40BRL0_9PEZI|nr:hypothetical protein B0T21DRAFT_409406 [Apiosordaria backusii]
METLEGLGLAANILQFCQAVGAFISQAHEIYRSGPAALGKLNDLRDISMDLRKMLAEMQRQDTQLKDKYPNTPQLALHNECLAILQDLTHSLDQLGFPEHPSKRDAIVIAFKSLWKRSKIEELEQRLANFRQQLVLGLLVTLRDFAIQSLSCQEAILQKLASTPKAVSGSGQENASTHPLLVDQSIPGTAFLQHLAAVGQLSDASSLAKSLSIRSLKASAITTILHEEGDGPTAPNIKLSPARETELQDQFLSSILGQEGMNHRESQIHEAHKQTFQWIFTETNEPKQAWDSFVEWLESESQLYWITGKAGSGKSTLMKFVSHHPELLHHLKVWSRDQPVTLASFYFWASGTAMQASPEGLFRSLLHQLLDQNRHMIPKLSPRAWESACLFGDSELAVDMAELRIMLGNAIQEISHSSKVCLLIDGLDEFNGDPDDLLDTIQEFMTHPIKVCVASRPWLVFEDAFCRKPQLLLQDLNRRDIEEYTKSSFNSNRGFKRLQVREPHFAQQLTENIIDKAQGAFLWVCVVVTSLLAGMKNDDRIRDLQRRLDDLPPDLEDLYNAIIKSWDPFYFQHAAQYFELLEANSSCDARIFYLADLENTTEYAIQMDQRPLSEEEYDLQVETVKRRLNSRCLGLLEVRTTTSKMSTEHMPDTVEYLHRTVKDYVTKPDVQARFRAATGSFDPYFRLCASYLAAAKSPVTFHLSSGPVPIIRRYSYDALRCASRVAKENSRVGMVRLLDELARILHEAKIPYIEVDVGARRLACNDLPDPAGTSFLSLATRMNVIEYVKARAHRSRETLSPLLIDLARTYVTDVNSFNSLLELGADYNFEFIRQPSNVAWDSEANFNGATSANTCTVWTEIFATAMMSAASNSLAYSSRRWLSILRLFLGKGAPLDRAFRESILKRCANIIPDCDVDAFSLILSRLRGGTKEEECDQVMQLLDFLKEPSTDSEYDTDASDDC